MSKVTYIKETPPVVKEVAPAQPASIFIELSITEAGELYKALELYGSYPGCRLDRLHEDLYLLDKQELI